MKSAAKRRNFFSAFIALALLFCASHVASANVLEISKTRAELKTDLGQNRVSESLFYSVKHDRNYDRFEEIALESSVAPKSLVTHIPSSGRKFNQIARRGWTRTTINDTVNNPFTTRSAINKANNNPATAFFNSDGTHVIRDNVTGELIQLSDRLNPGSWIPDPSIVNPFKP